jgi:Domain of unknown function (DUF1906)
MITMSSDFRSDAKEALAFEEEIQSPALQPQIAIETTTYAGLDAFGYPGAPAMAAYKEAGFSVTCVYLGNMPGRIGGGGNNGWISAASGLAGKGWGLAPTYLGAQANLGGSWTPSDPLGQAPIDAKEAAKLAIDAGFVKGQTIFLDVEAPFAAGSAQETYVLKWLASVQALGFKTALYCFPAQIVWARKQGVKIWTVHLYGPTAGKKDPVTQAITWRNLPKPLPVAPIDAGAIGTQCGFFCHAAGRAFQSPF